MYLTLAKLKASGKKLFLGTNSHTDYTEFIMKQTLGEKWKDLFDIICSYCRKPMFFEQDTKDRSAFYALDTTKKNYKGKEITHADDLLPGEIHIEGNVRIL